MAGTVGRGCRKSKEHNRERESNSDGCSKEESLRNSRFLLQSSLVVLWQAEESWWSSNDWLVVTRRKDWEGEIKSMSIAYDIVIDLNK